MGNREDYLRQALNLLKTENVEIKKVSSLYETLPVGYTEQRNFLNIAVLIETNMPPYELLRKINTIEMSLGRKRIKRWGPRTIDIDILLYDNIKIDDDILCIPHKRMFERSFVLIPLYEINHNISKDGFSIKHIINGLPDRNGVKIYKKNWYKVV